MDHFSGLDVSVKETSVCIVDETGKIVREVKVASEPEALLAVLKNPVYHFKSIGLEAGPLSQWLFSALAEAGLPVICVETRHMRAVLKAQINKTDRNDARGMAQMMRVGLARQDNARAVRPVRTVEPGPLRSDLQGARMTRTQHVRVEGTSYQRGRQYGDRGQGPRAPVGRGLPAGLRALRGLGLADRPARGRPVRGADRRVPARLPGGDARHRRRRRPRPGRRAGDQRAHRGDVLGQGPQRPREPRLPAECSAFALLPPRASQDR